MQSAKTQGDFHFIYYCHGFRAMNKESIKENDRYIKDLVLQSFKMYISQLAPAARQLPNLRYNIYNISSDKQLWPKFFTQHEKKEAKKISAAYAEAKLHYRQVFIHFIGFSLGGRLAIKLGRYMAKECDKVSLYTIAAANQIIPFMNYIKEPRKGAAPFLNELHFFSRHDVFLPLELERKFREAYVINSNDNTRERSEVLFCRRILSPSCHPLMKSAWEKPRVIVAFEHDHKDRQGNWDGHFLFFGEFFEVIIHQITAIALEQQGGYTRKMIKNALKKVLWE